MRKKEEKWLKLLSYCLITTLLAVTVLGFWVNYSNAAGFIRQASKAERRRLSNMVDTEIEDKNFNMVASSRYTAYRTVQDRKGAILFDGIDLETCREIPGYEAPWYNLLGKSDDEGERYVLANYDLTNSNYNLVTGLAKENMEPLTLTIDGELQEMIYEKMSEYGISGSFLMLNAENQIEVCVSTPGASKNEYSDSLSDRELQNRNLYTTIPGSTLKVVTLLLASMQGIDLFSDDLTFTCTGSYTLPDQTADEITCTRVHGTIGAEEALNYSCNAWFAQLIQRMDLNQAVSDLKLLGFTDNPDTEFWKIGNLNAEKSRVTLSGNTFQDTWSFIGQITEVNPVQMAWLLSCIRNESMMALPTITMDDPVAYADPGDRGDAFLQACSIVKRIWEEGFNSDYSIYSREYYGNVSAAKTGTAQQNTEANICNKLLECYTEQYTFYICFEGFEVDNQQVTDLLPIDLVNQALQYNNS